MKACNAWRPILPHAPGRSDGNQQAGALLMGAALQLPDTCPWVFSHLDSPQIQPQGFRGTTGFGGRAGCSMNPTAGTTLPEHGATQSLLLCCQARSEQQNSLCKKRVFTGPLSQAMWLSQLVCANKHTDFFFFFLRNQFFRNSNLLQCFLQILFPLPDWRDNLRTTCT